jgi:outer membrane protein OmpA-like peptidoglycan-associated protein
VGLFGSSNLKSTFNDGPIAFYDGYTKAVFTRNNIARRKDAYDSSGRMNLEIYFGDIEPSGKMTNIIPFYYNHVNYSVAQASVTKNGSVMYFSSDKPGGLGGADIYYCNNLHGVWSEPINAGPQVNTAGDEYYPFAQNDSTLFFSSNGRGGFGGLDMYISNRRNGKFRQAINLGSPLNSSRDDFSMVTDSTGRIGYFASNRPGGEGLDDIYFFKADHYTALGQIKESPGLTNAVPQVSIFVKDEDGNVISSTQSDSLGYFRLDLPLEENYSIWAKKQGYDVLEDIGFSTKGRDFGVDSILFPMWKQDLFVKGKIYSKETQAFLPGASVVLTNLSDNKVDSVIVGENGEYSALVYPNKKYTVTVHKPGFIPDGYNLNTDALYKGDLLNDVVVEEVYLEKSMINFDFNKMNITPESSKEINRIVRTLLKFPKTSLLIRAHADSRGSAQYNQLVSNKRAEAVVQYMMSKGVPRNRMDAKGFGEELVLNRCSDGVECTEEEHSKNRRAELKVQRD